MVGEEAGPEEFGRAVQNLATLFYADGGLLASPRPVRIQETMDVLTGLFDRVGMRTNVDKTVGMVCQPCHTSGRQFEVVYTW